ncbi:hypothetical protein PLIIFM63780_001995 [Purpureocillium lilacinum]|nr:hypothetical protein PLIIFM63780_001995 [Purpureocillium lilacinum]
MAEVFGIVSGSLSVAALFNNCVDCFEYIQLGRNFGNDYERSRLKLAVARLRLSRWGAAIGVNEDPRFAIDAPDDSESREGRELLEELERLFQAAHRSSKRYETRAKQEDLVAFKDEDMQEVARGLHNRLGLIARRRQTRTGLMKKAKWALYGAKELDRLLDQIASFLDDLEKLFPVETACHRLIGLEIEEVADEPSLLALQDAASGTDNALSDAAAGKLEGIAGRNYAKDIKTEETARVLLGNTWSEATLSGGSSIADQTMNTAGSITARGGSAVQVGNQYGGRGFFRT